MNPSTGVACRFTGDPNEALAVFSAFVTGGPVGEYVTADEHEGVAHSQGTEYASGKILL